MLKVLVQFKDITAQLPMANLSESAVLSASE